MTDTRPCPDPVSALFRARARELGAAGDFEVFRTHGARVFCMADEAWKVKLPVAFNYMDFSTLARREAACRREIEINRPAAPDIYLGVVPLTRAAAGGLEIAGSGEVEEWAVRMRRFRQDDVLSAMARTGCIDPALAAGLGRMAARDQARRPPCPGADPATDMARVVSGTAANLVAGGMAGAEAWHAAAASRLAACRDLLRARAAGGHVRRCHGDLHLNNIVMTATGPVPFDAIEFSESIATIDVLYDLAFLLMDLEHAGLPAMANATFNAWLAETGDPDHLDALAALPLYLSCRAAIRAMVALERGGPARHEAQVYFSLASRLLDPPASRLVAVGGFSGTGKTTLGRALAPGLGPAPGAVHLRSDVERKHMAGVAETERLSRSSYTRAASDAVYASLLAKARRALVAGHAVVLDAVFSDPAERAAAEAVARDAGVAFAGLWLEAGKAELVARVDARTGDASDADAAVVELQLARGAGEVGWTRVDASRSPAEVQARAQALL